MQMTETSLQLFDAENQRDLYSPSEFQCEILKLSFNDFVEQTNVKDVVECEFRQENNDPDARLSDDDLQSRMKFFYDFRIETHQYHMNGIKNLEFIECDCKRKKSKINHEEIEAPVTDTRNVKIFQDCGVQCSLMNYNTSDKSTNTDRIELESAFQSNFSDGNETSTGITGVTDCMTFSSTSFNMPNELNQ